MGRKAINGISIYTLAKIHSLQCCQQKYNFFLKKYMFEWSLWIYYALQIIYYEKPHVVDDSKEKASSRHVLVEVITITMLNHYDQNN